MKHACEIIIAYIFLAVVDCQAGEKLTEDLRWPRWGSLFFFYFIYLVSEIWLTC